LRSLRKRKIMNTTDKRKILLIDDEPDIIEFLGYNFRKEGFEIHAANDGEQALKVIEGITPDMIICDVMMPKMNGIVFCQKVKKHTDYMNIPFIFLSAYNDENILFDAIQNGGEIFLSKPIRFKMLLQIVCDTLRKN
jgi:two-component system alkaline phosphatase synthesis response regulator PhoP